MVNPTKRMAEAADVLKKIDLTDIVASLGLAVANAQEKLDDNSVKQLIRMSQTMVAGQSLLQLGFKPAFYAFVHADLNASISLSFRDERDTHLDVAIGAVYDKTKGFSQEHFLDVEARQTRAERGEFKSSRDFSMKANESKAITIEGNAYQMKQELGAVKKINEFCGCLSSIPAISCVSVQVCPKHKFVNKSIGYIVNYVGGYVTIYKPHGENVGILQIKDYTSLTRVDLDVTDTMGTGSEFSIATNFKTSFLAAKTANTGGIAIGYSKTQFIMDSDFQEFSVYFELNSSTIQFDYIQGDYSNGGNNGNLNKALSALAELLKNTQGLTIDIEGHTDSSGSDAMNKDLGQRRGDAVRDYLIKLGVTDMTKFKVVSKGEELAKAEGDSKRNPKFRKTTIKLAADSPDYIYFKAGKINPSATPLITAPDNNKFVYLSPTPPPPPASSTEKIEFDFDGVSYKIEPASLHAPNTPPPYTASSGFSSWWEKFDYDKTGDGDNIVHYLLYKETDICCTVYSQQKSDLNIEAKESESKYYVFENINESSLAHRDVQKIKDPSTVAVAATLDLHTAKKTEISMSGNASISAHLIAIPPPDGFGVIIQIINNYNNTFIYQ